MVREKKQREVLAILQNLRDMDGLKRLFWQALNCERQNKPLSMRSWPESIKTLFADDPVLFASGGEDNAFHVIYCRMATTSLLRSQERPIVNQLLRDHPYALFVFSNTERNLWHFVNVKYDEQTIKRRLIRRITVRSGDGLRTAAERIAMLDLEEFGRDLLGISALQIQQSHDQAFDVEAVTKEFYREIANWYFWARDIAVFPKDAPLDANGKPSLALIRLLTRLIFCWFLREKRNPSTGHGLIPDTLFDPQTIRAMLKDSSPNACTYYTAILQNLFFATLNTEMDMPGTPPNRRFIDESDGKNSDDHMIHQRWRNAAQLRDPSALEQILRGIPFLNGGLFECLDDRVTKEGESHTVEIRIDGFSNDPRKHPKLPNSLFFGHEEVVDLSAAYGDSSRSHETVRPLLDILRRYNFTLTENTPIEEEVALDPELLGHVFENLLAAYNPETGTVARKATGSFYTPRVVVDWMVDQALIVHLQGNTGILACGSLPASIPACDISIRHRNLPHWTKEDSIYWITFRLADSLPQAKLDAWKQERDAWTSSRPLPWSDADWNEYNDLFGNRLDEWLDAGHGSRALARPDIREKVRESMMKFDGKKLRIHAAVIMPTHVHALIEPLGNSTLPELLKGIKGSSARAANKVLDSSGTFWMDESYDHIVRSEAQYRHFVNYIADNPRKAGLAADDYWLHKVTQAFLPVDPQENNTSDPKASGEESDQNHRQECLCHLLSWEETGHRFKPAEVEKLIDAIDGLKIIDPACGSGAFPMGMLQKLVHVLRKLDPQNSAWRVRQQRAAEKIESGPARDEALKAIERAFARDNDDYGRKLYLIENCLYGVDIQPIAVQIAKLRFFVSLVVDQGIDPDQPNYGILPLPNLETKVVAANALLGLHRGQLLLGSNEVRELESQLQKIRHNYFTARSYKRKKQLRADDKRLCAALAKALADSGECTPYDAQRLADWNPYNTNESAPFFDPGWMFGLVAQAFLPVAKVTQAFLPVAKVTQAFLPVDSQESQTGMSGLPFGFDIVIGNPPYVRQEELKSQMVTGSDGKQCSLKDALRGQYDCFTGTADLYVYFFERSFQLLRIGGVLSFITSNKYFRAAYGERLRTYFAYATEPRVMLDFGDAPVFTSIAYPCIVVARKTRRVDHGSLPKSLPTDLVPENAAARVMTWQPGPDIRDFPDIFDQQASPLAQRELKPDGWRLESPVKLRLLEKLRKAGTPLGEYVKGRFYYGIKTGLNNAFVVDRATRDRLIAEHPSSAEVLKPFLRGRDVKRWRVEFADQYLIKIESSENVQHPWSDKPEKEAEKVFAKKFPAIHSHFGEMRKALIDRYDQGCFFWELRSCDYWQEFLQPKILYQEIATYQAFAWDESGGYTNNKTFLIPGVHKWLLAILNSRLAWWFYGQVASKLQGGAYAMQMPYVSQLPISALSTAQQKALERIADRIIAAKDKDAAADVRALEQEINEQVFKMYGLTKDEIKIIKDSGGLDVHDKANLV